MSATRKLLLGTASLGLCLFGAEMAGSGAAYADTLTYNLDTGLYPTELSASNHGNLEVPLFNSVVGALSGVAVTVVGIVHATGTATNNAASPEPLSYSKSSTITLSSTDLSQLVQSANAGGGLVVYSNIASFSSVMNGSTVNVGPLSGSTTKNFNYTSNLDQFERAGGGSTGLSVATLTEDVLYTGGGNFSIDVTSDAEVNVRVTYTYTPVEQSAPEPASMFLLGTAVAGIGAFRRRTKRRRPAA